jgi:hypothetical protein
VHGEEPSDFPDVGSTKQEVQYGGFLGKFWTMLINQLNHDCPLGAKGNSVMAVNSKTI